MKQVAMKMCLQYCLGVLALLLSAVGVVSFVQPVTHHRISYSIVNTRSGDDSRCSTTALHEKSLDKAELKAELTGYLKKRDRQMQMMLQKRK